MINIFIGYDPREDIAYQVCKHSILKRTPNAIIKPLIKKDLEAENWYTRPIDKLAYRVYIHKIPCTCINGS